MFHHREKPQLAIYDESYLCALSLRNSLKRFGFTIQEVSSNESELLRFLKLKPTVLLFHLDSSLEKAFSIIGKIKREYPNVKILAQTVRTESNLVDELKKNGAHMILSGQYGFKALVEKIIQLDPSFKMDADGIVDTGTMPDHRWEDPFMKIAANPKKLLLTRLLAAGNPTKVIAQVLDSPETDIEVLRKKLLHDTGCQNVAEYIGKAKDYKII